jgi:predicted acyltransferase
MWSGTKTWDPEGILSTLPAVATCLFGLLVGGFLRRKDLADGDKIAWLFSVAILAIITGLVWNGFFPMNKALWTSSFVLFTGGLATAALSLSYWLIDVQHYRRFTGPFVAFGSNAITVYVASGLIPFGLSTIKVNMPGGRQSLTQYLYETIFLPFLSPVNASLACALSYVIILSFPLWWMYKRKIFIKI